MKPHRLYVGTIGEGLWRSLDGGQTFVRACDGMFVECHVRALAVHPRQPHTLYLGSELGLFRSDNGADSWTRVESPMNGLQVWSILVAPDNSDRIVVGVCPSRLFVSSDAGRSWTEPNAAIMQECPRIIHTRVTTLRADPASPDTIWAGVEIDSLRRSQDGGKTWQALGTGLSSKDIHDLVIIPASLRGGHRLLASTNNDVNLSTDDGATWKPLGLGKVMPAPYFRGMKQKADQPETIFLGNGDAPPGSVGSIVRSTDGGVTWEVMRMPGRANSTIWNFAVSQADPDMIYASSVSGEVYRSTDTGCSWDKLPREFGEIRALAWTEQ